MSLFKNHQESRAQGQRLELLNAEKESQYWHQKEATGKEERAKVRDLSA
jgi:hypothetical protein